MSQRGARTKNTPDSSNTPRPAQRDRDEPIIGTPILDKLDEMEAPTPADVSERMIKRVRENVRQRRTDTAIAQRVANTAVTPVTQAIEVELAQRVRDRIDERLD